MAVKGPKKFTSEELKKIQDHQDKLNRIQIQFGQLTMTKIRLENQENYLKEQLTLLNKEEANIAKDLTDKYGKGSLDIETGEFIPAE